MIKVIALTPQKQRYAIALKFVLAVYDHFQYFAL